MKPPSGTQFGPILVGVWLILWGLIYAPFLKLSFEHSTDVLAVLGIVAGVLLVVRR